MSTTQILDALNDRLEFWREQQQAAFRTNDRVLAAVSARIIEEYVQLIANAATAARPAQAAALFIERTAD
jgi:hypothetical protein